MKQQQPEEIADTEHELVIERVCAIDVAKASGKVCVRVGSRAGRRVSKVWDVAATSGAVGELTDYLVDERIEKVTVESTSDYWRIWYYLLEAAGLDVQLVNARDVKNVPGRPKTDKLDAVWLAKLTEKGLLRPSFVPPAPIRELRDYTRLRIDMTRERSRYWQRIEKLLEDALIKVSSVASTLDTLSVRDMLKALIAGERDPRRLAGLARGKMRPKQAALVEALTGRFDDHHAELAQMLLDQIDALDAKIGRLTTRIDQLLAAMEPEPVNGGDATGGANPASRKAGELTTIDRLDEIPGVGPVNAQIILAEIGLDMSRFPTAGHLVSWAKLCPRTIQSGPVQRSGKAGKGNPYLKGALGEAATAAAKTNTFLGERYRRIVKRRGKLKALVAVARSILVIIWNLLHDPTARFHDLGADYHATRINTERRTRNHVAQLAALGYRVTLEPVA
ncbi:MULTISPECIES: IS110 family RNA-guided transposase [Mycobacteriaceae]|uniref:Transposase, IS116/IS110/IS902 family n=6 Tax=Mycobacteriaceae TaxID=1762 RepID=D5PE35_9MYCO|nr:transposase, IS116/IS110/IS902 family [Mycobacterium parascrofulaceum ATCC BAA-614]ETB46940.1 transposase IS110 [Mycobacterium avium 10-5560]ETZ27060.1 transposase IS116/IS110/IS902 family protein [Mycobacterium intracellulare MIN_061107_1834]ETZ59543.1 transposase IS116/IS110/IS902 family protein [Mycobacterium sp. MAC_080597_8934]ETZ69107.1 transposase IS116/IS110/IS902 family protein [Mycobacterium sp. MAC_011194_8550]KDP00009.1 transposase IS110 [Mycobacterium avium subsp. hominissuis 1